jgi:alpha-1,6-mannosyltransferase
VGRDPSAVFALAVLNPLVLLGLLGGAHNDALMLGLLVAGCTVARRHHVVGGLVLCGLAAEVKIPALIGTVFIGWWWAGAGAGAGRRVARVAVAVGFTVGLMAVVAALSSLGWRWVSGLSNPGVVVSWLDPATGVGLLLAHGASALGYGGHQKALVDGVRAAALILAAALSVRLLVRSERRGEVQALGWSLLAFVILGPVVWPWYETWGLVFLAVVADGWVLLLVLVASVVACFADMPSPGLLTDANAVLVALCWAAVVAVTCVYASRRIPGVVRLGARLRARPTEPVTPG